MKSIHLLRNVLHRIEHNFITYFENAMEIYPETKEREVVSKTKSTFTDSC